MGKKSFNELFVDVTKKGTKIKKECYCNEGKYQIIDQGKEEIAGYTNLEKGIFKDVPVLVFGDHTRIIKYIDKPFFLGADGVKVLRSSLEEANYKYLYYALKNVKIPDTGYNRHFKWLKDAHINYPSINKQKEIVAVLENIDILCKLYEKQLLFMDKLIKARFVEMFGDIDNNKYDYDIRCLNDVCEFIKDGTHQTPIYTQDKENGYKFISSKDVVLGSVDWNHLKYIPEDLHKKLYKHISPRRGDILLAKNGTTGIAAMVDRDEVFDIYVSLAILRPLNINSTYLLFAINSNATKRQFDACLKGIGVPNLHLGEIKKTKIIVPPLDKQSDFEKYAIQVDKSKLAVQQSLEKTQQLFDSLMQEYFG